MRAKLTRWSLLLQEYSFNLEHVPGKANELADYLSRNPDPREDPHPELAEERLDCPYPPELANPMIAVVNLNDVFSQCRESQLQSRAIQRTKRKWLEIQDREPENPEEAKFYDRYFVHDNTVYCRWGETQKLLVPRNMIQAVIDFYHNDTHPGTKETFRQVSRNFHCRNLRRIVNQLVKSCVSCAQIKGRQIQAAAPLRAHHPEGPYEVWSIDILGPYLETRKKNQYILVIEDIFTKWIEARAFPTVNTDDVINMLEEEIVPRFGAPRTIISDNARIFTSRKYLKMCRRYQITPAYSAAYHQRANPVERRVQEIKKVMRALMLGRPPNTWDIQIPKTLFTLRNRRNEATGETPATLVLGKEMPPPGSWRLPRPLLQGPNISREERLQRTRETQNQYRLQYAPPEREPAVSFGPGDQVMVRIFKRTSNRFNPVWEGPYPVLRKKSDVIYEVERRDVPVELHLDDIRRAPPGVDIPYLVNVSDQESDGEDHDPNDPEPSAQPPEDPMEGTSHSSGRTPQETSPAPRNRSPEPTPRLIVPGSTLPRRRRVRLVIRDASPPGMSTSEVPCPIPPSQSRSARGASARSNDIPAASHEQTDLGVRECHDILSRPEREQSHPPTPRRDSLPIDCVTSASLLPSL